MVIYVFFKVGVIRRWFASFCGLSACACVTPIWYCFMHLDTYAPITCLASATGGAGEVNRQHGNEETNAPAEGTHVEATETCLQVFDDDGNQSDGATGDLHD